MSRCSSFPPILGALPRVLILGSMPGAASLAAGQYYAHPRNAFWPILGELLGFAPTAPYDERVAALQAHGIAVWDVLQTCIRPGSLDAAIERDSEVANDLPGLLAAQPGIATICFNGGAAAATFRRHVPAACTDGRRLVPLPSTSPANASWSFARKLSAWRVALAPLENG
jgi:TDG/mug DNA glycosylase family protein